jgi:hypothetical protein
MNSLKKTFVMLMIAAGLVGAGCGDDDKDTDNGGNGGGNDAGGNGGNGDAGGSGGVDLTISCLTGGIYDGVKAEDIMAKVTEGAACATEVQVAQICEVNPSTEAGKSGSACAATAPADKLEECTIEGDGASIKGLRSAAPDLSDPCLKCFSDSVACSAMNCLSECLGKPMDPGCTECRETKECTPKFYACAGLPRLEELQ